MTIHIRKQQPCPLVAVLCELLPSSDHFCKIVSILTIGCRKEDKMHAFKQSKITTSMDGPIFVSSNWLSYFKPRLSSECFSQTVLNKFTQAEHLKFAISPAHW